MGKNMFQLTLAFAFTLLIAPRSGAAGEPGMPVFQGLTEISRRTALLKEKPRDELFESHLRRADSTLQPELLIFNDLSTGHEVWRLTWDLSRNTPHCHINRSPWNADGSLFAFNSDRWIPGSGSGGTKHIFIMNADGGGLRVMEPLLNGKPYYDLVLLSRHVIWDRFNPRRMYFVDRQAFYLADLTPDMRCMASRVAGLEPAGRRREIYSYVSDNNIVMIKDRGSRDYEPFLYFFDMRRDSPDFGKMIRSYPFRMNLDLPGHDRNEEWHIHDITFRRDPQDRYILDYGPWDRPGEPIFWEFPLDGDKEKVRLCYAARSGMRPYFSHPAWAAGGSLVAYYGDSGRETDDFGLHVWDYENDRHLARVAGSREVSGGHIAWDGNDRQSFFASPSPHQDTKYSGKIIQAYLDGSPVKELCTTYTQWQDTAGGKEHDYCSIARPAQSPDGTKCFFSSTMLQPDVGAYDCYVVVARKPAPPVALSAVPEKRGVRLTWKPAGLSGEIKLYRIWKIKGVNNSFLPLAECPAGQCSYVDDNLDKDDVYYYAVTSQEHSGLESDRLSPVLEVKVSDTGEFQIQNTLKSGTGWDNIPPDKPEKLTGTKISPGDYYLEWESSPSADLRYYNLYYADNTRPTAGPECLIASLPAGEVSFFDYAALKNGKARYMLIAVDRQGNLSAPAFYDEL